ncbi:MAG: thioredoxin family protein [Candidatus Micrarchaeia archaeon]|jgi:small redox-active disulfide protein 2
MKIEIFGTGCPACLELEKRAKAAVAKLKAKATVSHVFDINEIADRGVYAVPAIAIDGKVVLSGKVASQEEIEKAIAKKSKEKTTGKTKPTKKAKTTAKKKQKSK